MTRHSMLGVAALSMATLVGPIQAQASLQNNTSLIAVADSLLRANSGKSLDTAGQRRVRERLAEVTEPRGGAVYRRLMLTQEVLGQEAVRKATSAVETQEVKDLHAKALGSTSDLDLMKRDVMNWASLGATLDIVGNVAQSLLLFPEGA